MYTVELNVINGRGTLHWTNYYIIISSNSIIRIKLKQWIINF